MSVFDIIFAIIMIPTILFNLFITICVIMAALSRNTLD